MTYCILVLCFLVFGYAVLIACIANRWQQEKITLRSPGKYPIVSIIIAARNEEQSIKSCIDALLNNDYRTDKFEVIVIDDHSTDRTSDIIQSYSDPIIKYINLQSKGISGSKKQALAYASTIAKGDIWMYTDADCSVPITWISEAVSKFDNDQNLDILLGSVGFFTADNHLQAWQYLDTIGMMAVTNAGVQSKQWYLANGANLAIRKKVWSIAGYDVNQTHKFASGDDVSLVQTYASQFPDNIAFLASRSYVVLTQGQGTFKELIQQRLRWATKNSNYSNFFQKVVMGVPFSLSLACMLAVLAGVWRIEYSMLGLACISLKAVIDTLYLGSIQQSFLHQINPIPIFFHSVLHTLYIGVFGLASFLPIKYRWKGRKVK